MTGPRRPPASRGGTATLGSRAGGDRQPAPEAPRARRSTKAAPAPARKTSGKVTERASSRAMARVDGPRGRRDGAAEEARRRKVRLRARVMVGFAVSVLLVGVLFVTVWPTSNFLDQRSDASRLEAELAEIRTERAAVEAEIDRLATDAEIEAQARRNGYVKPGEEAYNILPTPVDPIGLPEGWPFTGVEEAMGVR